MENLVVSFVNTYSFNQTTAMYQAISDHLTIRNSSLFTIMETNSAPFSLLGDNLNVFSIRSNASLSN